MLDQLADALIEETRSPKSVCYLSLDDNLLKLVSLRELLALYREHIHPEGKPAVLLLDEIHYASNWEQELKSLVDHHPEYRIVATGSSSLDHGVGGAHAGVGRWEVIPIPTLSFFEFLQIRGESPAGVPEELRVLNLWEHEPEDFVGIGVALRATMPLFRRYLLVGGFPETAKEDDIIRCQRLLREDIVDRVLKRDITSLFGVRNVNELERLFLYICLHSGGQLNVQTCTSQLGANRTTVINHLELLTRANLLFRLEPETTGKKALKGRHKYYLADAALRNAVLLSGEEILHDSREAGIIVETAVLRHFYASHYVQTPRFTYWYDAATEKEVDLVMRLPSVTTAIEVKYRDPAVVDASSGLSAFCRAHPKARPLVITEREADFGIAPLPGTSLSMLRIPAHVFCYLIGQSERSNAGAAARPRSGR